MCIQIIGDQFEPDKPFSMKESFNMMQRYPPSMYAFDLRLTDRMPDTRRAPESGCTMLVVQPSARSGWEQAPIYLYPRFRA